MSKLNREVSQWIILMNDKCVNEDDEGHTSKPTFCKLRHPRTNKGAMFLFCHDDKKIFEVAQFKEDFRSWFVNETVQEDGSLYITTPVNAAFLILPYLIKEEKHGKFKPLDQILVDDEFTECHRLCSCEEVDSLENFCEIKGPEDLRAYRFSKDKSLSWLKRKVNQIAKKMESKQINISGGSHTTSYVQSKKSEHYTEDCIRYAHGVLSEYLPSELSKDLKEHMGIKDPVVVHEKPAIDEPKSKRAKKDKVNPTDDYSINNTDNNNTKSVTKLTTAQKQLSKVDKSGMKSIASFFSPKSKK